MSAPVYVIREGHVRGHGRYLQACMVGPVWGEPQLAARFFSLVAASLDLDPKCARIVRVVVKPRQVVSLAHHIVCVATARLAALDEAEQACLEERRRCNMHASWGMASGARNCVAAIAALKVLP